jgi:imidazolonepropionase-like amidohydrolase
MLAAFAPLALRAQASPGAVSPRTTVLLPDAVYDGTGNAVQRGWGVVVRANRIVSVGPAAGLDVPADAERIALPGTTLLPGLSDLHSHVLLHPYDETPWNDQVLRESLALRTARAVNHLRATLMAGFTVLRDLGTEGAEYADVGLKEAVDQGIIPGPRMFVTTKAIVATGSYGPKGFGVEIGVPQGAEEADGVEGLTRVVRDQIGHGADWIKIYATTAGVRAARLGRRSPRRSGGPSSTSPGRADGRWWRTRARTRASGAPSTRAWRPSTTATRRRSRRSCS